VVKLLASIVVLGGLALGSGVAAADEVKTAVTASLILDIVSAPVSDRRSAFDEALRSAPPAPDRNAGEVLPDGSVRYGRTTITVKNPCPPGEHYEPRPLPGRRR